MPIFNMIISLVRAVFHTAVSACNLSHVVGKVQSTAMTTDLLHSGVDRYGVEI